MKKFYLLLFMLCFVLFSFGQKYYCESDGRYYDVNENLALKSAVNMKSVEASSTDTVWAGAHITPYISTNTRGYFFQAQSSFSISSVMCAEEGNLSAAMQSVEIVSFGATYPVAYSGPGTPHVTLFSALNVAKGWVDCDVDVVAGNYYGVIGAKHDVGGNTMYNSYGASPQDFVIDGIPTTCSRLLFQGSLATDSPLPGDYMSVLGSSNIGRVHFTIGHKCIEDIVQDNDPGKCGAVVTYEQPASWALATVTRVDASGVSSGDLFPVGTTTQSYKLVWDGGTLPPPMVAEKSASVVYATDTCTFTVTVNDIEAPILNCLNDTTLIAEPGEIGAVFNYGTGSIVSGEAVAGIMLPFSSNNTPSGVAYNPQKKLYYIVYAGSNNMPLVTFDESGNQLFATTTGFDFRGLWWNPNTSKLEGNSFAGQGYRSVDLDANGYALSSGINNPGTNNQVNSQSVADYDYDTDEVIYYNDGMVYRTSRVTGLLLGSYAITGLPSSLLNLYFVGYTGVSGSELLVYDNINRVVYFIDKSSGAYSGSAQLPLSAPNSKYYRASYSNGYFWVADNSGWHSYKIVEGSGGGVTAEDNCESDPLIEQTAGLPSGSEFPIGTTTNSFKVKDAAGHEVMCSFDVTVIGDVTPPEVICNPYVVSLERNGEYTLTADDIKYMSGGTSDDITSYDDLTITITPSVFDCSNVGDTTVIITATDEAGNSAMCEAVVTVENRIPIQLLSVDDIEVVLESGVCETKVDYPYIYAIGPCVTVTQLEGLGHNGVFPAGTTTEVWEATNTSGKSETISFTVTVISESTMPTIDSIADVVTDEDTPLAINLSGITNGGSCDMAGVTISVIGADPMLISNVVIDYITGDSTGSIMIIPAENMSGEAELTVEVSDVHGAKISKSFTLTINPVNDPPLVVQSLPGLNLKASETMDVSLSKLLGVVFDDVDDDALDYTVRFESGMLPNWISATDDPEVFTLILKPLQADTGCYNVIVDAVDMAGAMASDTFELCVDKLLVGIDDLDESIFEVKMYPNPSRGMVTIETESNSFEETKLTVMNIAGAEIFRKTYRSGEFIRFDMSEHVSGMYMVFVEVENQRVVKKLILDRK